MTNAVLNDATQIFDQGNLGAAFGATLYRDFVRIRSTLCKSGKSVYMFEIS
jgi:hypothetical protein